MYVVQFVALAGEARSAPAEIQPGSRRRLQQTLAAGMDIIIERLRDSNGLVKNIFQVRETVKSPCRHELRPEKIVIRFSNRNRSCPIRLQRHEKGVVRVSRLTSDITLENDSTSRVSPIPETKLAKESEAILGSNVILITLAQWFQAALEDGTDTILMALEGKLIITKMVESVSQARAIRTPNEKDETPGSFGRHTSTEDGPTTTAVQRPAWPGPRKRKRNEPFKSDLPQRVSFDDLPTLYAIGISNSFTLQTQTAVGTPSVPSLNFAISRVDQKVLFRIICKGST
ncbi:hypothetical protein VTN00DRAFT_4329 [Thermoascus crustaceus]|uniref:uncharacterized protein n=1 Tax=Thermoascus crustaceus TaxID=5088 RepID=UPI0037443D3D